MDEVPLVEAFLLVVSFSLLSKIPPVMHTYHHLHSYYRGSDKSLTPPVSKKANISVRME